MTVRVLAVDDDEAVLRATKRILARIPEVTEVEALTDPRAAVQLVASGRRFDAVVSDFSMPGMNGHEMRERIRELDVELASRFVVVSGGATTPRLQSVLDSMDERLVKPYRAEDLRQALLRIMSRG